MEKEKQVDLEKLTNEMLGESKVSKRKKNKENNSSFLSRYKTFLIVLVVLIVIFAFWGVSFLKLQKDKKYVDEIFNIYEEMVDQIDVKGITLEDDATYYFDISSFSLSSEIKDTFKDAYFILSKHNDKLNYAWTSLDDGGYYIPFVMFEHLEVATIEKESEKENIFTGKAFNWSEKIIFYDENLVMKEIIPGYEIEKKEADKCFKYVEENNTIKIKDYDISCGTDVEIPSMIGGIPVVSVLDSAFYNKGIVSLVLHYNLESIGNSSFSYNDISELIIPDSVKEIGEFAFYGNKIKSVVLSENLEKISSYTFALNKLEILDIPKNITLVDDYAFLENELEEIKINGYMTLGIGSFAKNKVSKEDAFIYSFNQDGTKDYSKIIGYSGNEKNIEIPSKKENIALTTIGTGAFASSGLENVTFPATVQVIEASSFFDNSLVSVKFPNKLRVIGAEAFRDNKISSMSIPASVTFIGTGAFINNQMSDEEAFIYKRTMGGIDYSSIVSYAGAKREKVVIPSVVGKVKLTSIDGFYSSSLVSFELPEIVTIANGAFNDNLVEKGSSNEYLYALKDGKWDYSTIVSYAGKERENVVIPKSYNDTDLIEISPYSFAYCDIKNIEIPNAVEKIGESSFLKDAHSNSTLIVIKNTTSKPFDWNLITGSSYKASFVTGTIKHQFGDVTVSS